MIVTVPVEYVVVVVLLVVILGFVAWGAIRTWWRERKGLTPRNYGE